MTGKEGGKRGIFEAAGGIVWRKIGEDFHIAVVHRPNYDDWTLPKGTREKGESMSDTALREVKEETSCKVKLESFAGCTWYEFKGLLKVVYFWHMTVDKKKKFKPNEETDQLLWLTTSQASERLDYQSEQDLITHAPRFLKDG